MSLYVYIAALGAFNYRSLTVHAGLRVCQGIMDKKGLGIFFRGQSGLLGGHNIRDRMAVIITALFFVFLLLVGLAIYGDYGVHMDEGNNQACGQSFYQYAKNFNILNPIPFVVSHSHAHNAIHGPVYEMFLVALKENLELTDQRDIILMRHLCTFLVFYLGVLFFYLLCRYHFESRWLAMLGCLFLVLHPRIFSHAFITAWISRFCLFISSAALPCSDILRI